jgi:UPF0716 protein FxsA
VLGSGRLPGRELADAALILVGGTLLLTPGFVSDVFGFFCVLPFTRPVARRGLLWAVQRRAACAVAGGGPGLRRAGRASSRGSTRRGFRRRD